MGNMAMIDTPIADITPELLIGRLLYAFEKWISGEIPVEKVKEFPGLTEDAVSEFFANADHGYAHSCAVYKRAREIVAQSPNIIRLVKERECLPEKEIDQILTWASMLHDLMRFFGYGSADHEAPAAEVARSAFWNDGATIEYQLLNAIVYHDYFCPISDEEELPLLFMKSPLAEIFRLADKISLSPAEEIERWYQYGLRLGQKFFKPDLPDKTRFDFLHNSEQRDQLSVLLVFFALQPSDFYAREAAEIYRQWARGKTEALCRLMTICREEGVSERSVMETVIRYHDHFGLHLPEGIEGLRIYQELHKGKI